MKWRSPPTVSDLEATIRSLAAILSVAVVAGCARQAPPRASAEALPGAGGSSRAPNELEAYERARPVFERYCAACHSTDGARATPGALQHFTMNGYPFGGHHASEITTVIVEVLGATGEETTMPLDAPGAIKGEDLKLVLEWAEAFFKAHYTGPRERDQDDHEAPEAPPPSGMGHSH